MVNPKQGTTVESTHVESPLDKEWTRGAFSSLWRVIRSERAANLKKQF